MPARILDGRALAKEFEGELSARSAALREHGVQPTLAVVVAGDDPGSQSYVRGIRRLAERVGIDVRLESLPGDVGIEELRARLMSLGTDDGVHGILLQQPLPSGVPVREVVDAIAPHKDVDGANPLNQGRLAFGTDPPFVPATPAAVMSLLERSAKWPLRGREVVVVGRSNVIGLPVALLLIRADATVTVTHRSTADLAAHLRRAEIVVVAAGKAGLVTGAMLRDGATVIDVGTNVVDGKVVGDVEFPSASQVADEITPVPGGVGPVTNAALMRNVLIAAERLAGGSVTTPR